MDSSAFLILSHLLEVVDKCRIDSDESLAILHFGQYPSNLRQLSRHTYSILQIVS